MKTAIVTGAARGIGLATSRQLIDAGWQVILLDRDEAALTEAVTGLQNARPCLCDVSQPDQVAAEEHP